MLKHKRNNKRISRDVIASSAHWQPRAIAIASRKIAEASPPSDFVVCSSLAFDRTTQCSTAHRRIAPTLPSSCIWNSFCTLASLSSKNHKNIKIFTLPRELGVYCPFALYIWHSHVIAKQQTMAGSSETVQISLISPGPSSLHLSAREVFCFYYVMKLCVLGEQSHVYATSKVNQLQCRPHIFCGSAKKQ